MDKEKLVEELRYSLPSMRMLSVVDNGAVLVDDELIYLKKRDDTPFDDFIVLNEIRSWDDLYEDLVGENVIFSVTLFGIRGQEAISKFLENKR